MASSLETEIAACREVIRKLVGERDLLRGEVERLVVLVSSHHALIENCPLCFSEEGP